MKFTLLTPKAECSHFCGPLSCLEPNLPMHYMCTSWFPEKVLSITEKYTMDLDFYWDNNKSKGGSHLVARNKVKVKTHIPFIEDWVLVIFIVRTLHFL